MSDEILSQKKNIIRYQSDFVALRYNRDVFHGRSCLIFSRKNGIGYTRFAFSISRKSGKAFYRNRVKRVLREYLRINLLPFNFPVDFLIVIKTGPVSRDSMISDISSFISKLRDDFSC